jgi:hypothetical protein
VDAPQDVQLVRDGVPIATEQLSSLTR